MHACLWAPGTRKHAHSTAEAKREAANTRRKQESKQAAELEARKKQLESDRQMFELDQQRKALELQAEVRMRTHLLSFHIHPRVHRNVHA